MRFLLNFHSENGRGEKFEGRFLATVGTSERSISRSIPDEFSWMGQHECLDRVSFSDQGEMRDYPEIIFDAVANDNFVVYDFRNFLLDGFKRLR